ncbi:hypothetical protein B5X24_HaOG201437 [Helicoverpa armigera]|nr:hypothetical protein B5X24_HaOG201437 [Helicoverpa armigera]
MISFHGTEHGTNKQGIILALFLISDKARILGYSGKPLEKNPKLLIIRFIDFMVTFIWIDKISIRKYNHSENQFNNLPVMLGSSSAAPLSRRAARIGFDYRKRSDTN